MCQDSATSVMKTRKSKAGSFLKNKKSPKTSLNSAKKDADARWLKKGIEPHYGYKDHVKCDVEREQEITRLLRIKKRVTVRNQKYNAALSTSSDS